jgi:hypothetical protein
MSYLIKLKDTRGYVTNFYTKQGIRKVSYHKHMTKAKCWKTELGAKNALNKYYEMCDINDKIELIIIEKNMFETKSDENILNQDNNPQIIPHDEEDKKDNLFIKIKNYLSKAVKKYIEEIKYYL